MSNFHLINVAEVIRETENCVTILFKIPEAVKEDFEFVAGQYLTLKAEIDGNEVRRAYSICTAPFESRIGVSVKKVPSGAMSSFLNEKVKAGDKLEIMRPEGKFTLITLVDIQRDHYFFAAGSGITPVMSMIKAMLENEPKSTAYLLYGSKDENNIIFKEELEKMQEQYQDQFIAEFTLSNPIKNRESGLLGVIGKKKTSWRGLKGRINSGKVAKFIQDHPPKSLNKEYYICGPGDMIDIVSTTLLGNGTKKSNIHKEFFSVAGSESVDVANIEEGAKLKAILGGKEINLIVLNNKTILDTLLDAGFEAPYSCTSGACSTCMAKVLEGSAEMEACYALDDDEIEDGYILTCQSHPTSPNIVIHFEE